MERKLARLARRAHGVVSRRQLLEAGLTRTEIAHRLRRGDLIAVFRGVYRVGHTAPSSEAGYTAAVMAGGDGALLSGRPAGHLLELLKGAPPPPEVTAPKARRVKGVRVRRGRRQGTVWRGIPVITVAETMVDLAAELTADELARAFHQAGIRHHTTPAQVEAALARRPNAPGATTLRRVLRGDVHVTLSTLEKRFLALLKQHRLPLPHTNQPAGSRRVDCRWPHHHLTVELDGYRYHRSRHAWENDRHRERQAHARGDHHRRYTYNDVLENPALMLAELTELLRKSH